MYKDSDGRLVMVSQLVAPRKRDCRFCALKYMQWGSTRFAPEMLQPRSSREAAQDDLDAYAKEHNLPLWSDKDS